MRTTLTKHWRIISMLSIAQIFSFACEQKEKLVYVEVEKEVIREVEVEKAGSETTTVDTTTTSETTATTPSTTATSTSTTGGLTLASANVTLQGDFTIGSLAVNLDENNRSFKVYKKKKSNLRVRTASDYKLFCTTFEDVPKACSINLTEDGSYEGVCENFAGTSFGCFLRNGEETLTTLEFGSDTSMVSGAGKIKSAIVYDPDKKSAQAVIDEEESTALAPENVADALKANNAVTTEIGNITGGWKLTCLENSASGMNCTSASTTTSTTADPYGTVGGSYDTAIPDPAMTSGGSSATQNKKELPDSLFLSVFDQGKRVALWESKDRHDKCIASTMDASGYFKEQEPGFGLKFDDVLYAYRFDNRDLLYASIDKAVFNLYNSGADGAEVINNIIRQTDMRNSWVKDQCKPANNPYANSSNCKLALEKTETSTYTDYYTKQVVSYSWTTWPTAEDFDAAGFAYTGTIREESTDCTFDITDGSGKPFCPAHADSMGTYSTYYGKDANNNDARLMLACKLSYTYGSSSNTYTYSWINQVPSPDNTLADAVTFMNDNQGCSTYTYDKPGSHPFNGKIQKMVKEYRRTMLDLANTSNYYSDLTNLCGDVVVDEGTWNFAQCQDLENSMMNGSMTGGNQQRPPGLMLCWQKWNFSYLGLIEDRDESNNWVSGKYRSDTDGNLKYRTVDNDRWFLGENCADDLNTFDAAVVGVATSDPAYEAAKIALYHACQKTTGSIDGTDVPSLSGQIAFARQTALKWDIPAKTLICGSSSASLTNKVLASAQNSCMPDVYLMPFCDMTGNCMEALRCPGSSSGGKCFKSGEFVGQIPGRLGLMTLKPRVNNAFEMTQISLDSWNMWNNSSQKMETCEMTSTTILNARKKSASEFDTIFKVTQNEACEEQAAATDTAGTGTTSTNTSTAGTTSAGSGGNTSGTMAKQSLGNILKKFNFKKCAQDDCSGE